MSKGLLWGLGLGLVMVCFNYLYYLKIFPKLKIKNINLSLKIFINIFIFILPFFLASEIHKIYFDGYPLMTLINSDDRLFLYLFGFLYCGSALIFVLSQAINEAKKNKNKKSPKF
jgi:hypothetical protein